MWATRCCAKKGVRSAFTSDWGWDVPPRFGVVQDMQRRDYDRGGESVRIEILRVAMG